jgi:hypothetical protein
MTKRFQAVLDAIHVLAAAREMAYPIAGLCRMARYGASPEQKGLGAYCLFQHAGPDEDEDDEDEVQSPQDNDDEADEDEAPEGTWQCKPRL